MLRTIHLMPQNCTDVENLYLFHIISMTDISVIFPIHFFPDPFPHSIIVPRTHSINLPFPNQISTSSFSPAPPSTSQYSPGRYIIHQIGLLWETNSLSRQNIEASSRERSSIFLFKIRMKFRCSHSEHW